MSVCLIYVYAADVNCFRADFRVADKVSRGGYFDDVLGTKGRYIYVYLGMCRCLVYLVDMSFGLGTIPIRIQTGKRDAL